MLSPWLRTEDCTFALTHLIERSPLGEFIDADRIGAIGHASGGATVLELAGAAYDAGAMQEYCRTDSAKGDRGTSYARFHIGLRGFKIHRGQTRRDGRVKVVVALDPSLGPGHSVESLKRVRIPVHIVAALADDYQPFGVHAARYARNIPGAGLTSLAHGEGHLVFVDQCKGDRRNAGLSLCHDADTVDRERVHRRLRTMVREFFERRFRETGGGASPAFTTPP